MTKSRYAYRKSADLGDVRAQLIIGFQQKNKMKYSAARDYFEKASRQGSAEAMNELGELCYHGLGVPEDYEKALGLFKESARKGYQFAIDNLNQLNVPIDQKEGVISSIEDDVSSLNEDAYVEIEDVLDETRLSRLMAPKTLPFKKRFQFSHFKIEFMDRVESPRPEESVVQESKRQKLCLED